MTIEWAGGETDFSKVPFTMFVKSIKVTDYSTGKEYRYTDMSGKWQSIEAVGGKVNGQGTPGEGPKVESSTQESSPSTSAPAPVPTVPGGGIGNPQAPTTGSSPSQTKGPSPTMTSLLGLPSSWIVTETGTGGVVTPTSAAVSETLLLTPICHSWASITKRGNIRKPLILPITPPGLLNLSRPRLRSPLVMATDMK